MKGERRFIDLDPFVLQTIRPELLRPPLHLAENINFLIFNWSGILFLKIVTLREAPDVTCLLKSFISGCSTEFKFIFFRFNFFIFFELNIIIYTFIIYLMKIKLF